MEIEAAVSYQAAVPGSPVLTRSGREIGTLEHVLEVPGLDHFDGIVIAPTGACASSAPTGSS